MNALYDKNKNDTNRWKTYRNPKATFKTEEVRVMLKETTEIPPPPPLQAIFAQHSTNYEEEEGAGHIQCLAGMTQCTRMILKHTQKKKNIIVKSFLRINVVPVNSTKVF